MNDLPLPPADNRPPLTDAEVATILQPWLKNTSPLQRAHAANYLREIHGRPEGQIAVLMAYLHMMVEEAIAKVQRMESVAKKSDTPLILPRRKINGS